MIELNKLTYNSNVSALSVASKVLKKVKNNRKLQEI